MPARQLGPITRHRVLSTVFLTFTFGMTAAIGAQTAPNQVDQSPSPEQHGTRPPGTASLAGLQGLPVRRISFEGIGTDRLTNVSDQLAQAVGAPLVRENLASSLHELFATGLYETVQADAIREGDGVALVFRGTPRMFIGKVTVDGAKGATVNTQLERASRLNAGTRFTEDRAKQAVDRMRQALSDSGYHEPAITYVVSPHPEEQLVDVAFKVDSGVRARVGSVGVTGDTGMPLNEFIRHAKLKTGSTIDRDTNNRALTGVLKHYQKQERLEAEIKLVAQTYVPETRRSSFQFSANRGPVVKVRVEGAKVSGERLKRSIPVFEEGTVDEDLLNEGNRRLRDYFQRLGYFDVKVDHLQHNPESDVVSITYTVALGERRRVDHVSVDGNHYFGAKTLEELLSVRAADKFDRHGAYSQALVSSDINGLKGVYQNNGFSEVRITPETLAGNVHTPAPGQVFSQSAQPLSVIYHIEEGSQQRVGDLSLAGVIKSDPEKLHGLMNTASGQLFSPQNLAGDRDALLTDYLSRGFDQVRIEVEQQTEAADPAKVDVVFHIFEGQQVFVRKVLVTGLNYTRPDTVVRAITLHPGDPLNLSALAETQRNLYDYALFNEVNTAIENPTGGELYKTVLLQTTEARRWTMTYGLGFEAQTGTPQNNCAGISNAGAPCTPEGTPGISPRVVFDITRNNLFGREQSASLRTTYGLLEQNINLLFQNPHFYGNRDFGFTFSGGYASSQDVTTYVSSKLEAGFRWSQHFSRPGSFLSRANTLIYDYSFRRVKVNEQSLQVGPSEIAALSSAVRVAGPAVTWIRDTRDSPIDSHRGTYSSFSEFNSNAPSGAEAHFNRLDLSNSSYYGFNKNRFVFARNTRYGQERAFGPPEGLLIPLPERLYAGGAISHRGFSINAAGPRDPETGFPIGGAGALINSTEMRLPPPMLPFFGDTISFVLFEDMGNVFTNAGDAWASALRIEQPDREKCKELATVGDSDSYIPSGPITSTGHQGQCSFNYFSHAAGLGVRYHTPVGPIRLDFSYNLNPPIYPVNIDYSLSDPFSNPHVGQSGHFNFFFSLGQTF
jgi:outer membrane protein insertion porin family